MRRSGSVPGNSRGLPEAPETVLAFDAFVSAADTVKARASNVTAAAIDPVAAIYRVTVFRA